MFLILEVILAIYAGTKRGWGGVAAMPIAVSLILGFAVGFTGLLPTFLPILLLLDFCVFILYIVMCIYPNPASKKGKQNDTSKNNSEIFCDIAIDLDFIDNSTAQSVLDEQKVDTAAGESKPIGAYLFNKGYLSKEQIGQVLKMQEKIER